MPAAKETQRQRANRLAEETEGAYSFDRYRSWPSVAIALIRLGLTDNQIKAIMLSKWVRWAADGSDHDYGRVPGYVAANFSSRQSRKDLAELVMGTFGVDK